MAVPLAVYYTGGLKTDRKWLRSHDKIRFWRLRTLSGIRRGSVLGRAIAHASQASACHIGYGQRKQENQDRVMAQEIDLDAAHISRTTSTLQVRQLQLQCGTRRGGVFKHASHNL